MKPKTALLQKIKTLHPVLLQKYSIQTSIVQKENAACTRAYLREGAFSVDLRKLALCCGAGGAVLWCFLRKKR